MTTLALLHTSPAHVPVFDALRDDEAPGLELRHLVHGQLLDRARESGPHAVTGDVRAVLAGAVARGADAVLCTCSTIGAVAEAASVSLGVPVLRVDRPMAAAAVAHGRRIAVVATVESTLEPTAALIREEDALRDRGATRDQGATRVRGVVRGEGATGEGATGEGVTGEGLTGERATGEGAGAVQALVLRTVLAEGAWAHFESGDAQAYCAAIARTVDALCDVDVVVLAQASMAPAAARTTCGVPVLASPRSGCGRRWPRRGRPGRVEPAGAGQARG
ncbi:hypothetical protein ABZX93_09000 [Streptomyces sp. NPDC006632]|uniref:hypothetical protein n=1 Tax=Streptomyces sp. NPDC006632 TaxID=3157182 RepID=UPI0033AFFBAC